MGHVWLIGMMGSGKTTIGRGVAASLGLPFTDSDAVIEKTANRSIEEIFSEGEAVFREVERQTVTEIARMSDRIVATGGGVVIDQRNVATMRSSGTTVLLDADVATLKQRLSRSDHRPLAKTSGDVAAIAESRSEIYAAAADVTIDTSNRSAAEVVNEVASCRPM